MQTAVINLTFCMPADKVQIWNHWLMKSVVPLYLSEPWLTEWHVEQVMSRTADMDYSFALRLHADSLDQARAWFNQHQQELQELARPEFGDQVMVFPTLLAILK